MANKKRSKHLEDFIRYIKDEWKGTFRRSPDLTIFALKDEQVCAAIEKRFREEAGITAVRQLDYDFYTGLHNLVFEFSPRSTDLARGRNAFLAILDSNGKLIALIDPFDPEQPNKFVPPLPKESEQPFVLARPSATAEVSFSEQDMYPLQVRSQTFFERMAGPGTPVEAYTKSPYTTRTPSDYWTDYNNDDCKVPDLA